MKYWLVKTEPGTFGWHDLVREQESTWDGIRNFQARNNLQAMATGDQVLIYHTGDERAVIGIAKVTAAAFPEPGATDWVAVKLAPLKKLKHPVTLAVIKADPTLAAMSLIRLGRLSVHPVGADEFKRVVERSAQAS